MPSSARTGTAPIASSPWAHGLPHYQIDATHGPRVIQAAFHIQTVNSLHSRFKAFIRPFCGPATKNLSAYIAWFIGKHPARVAATRP